MTVLTDSLRVVTADDSSDIPEITAAMREHVLQVDSFPQIAFASTQAIVGDGTVHLCGDLTMLGTTRPVDMHVALDVTPAILHVQGTFTIKQTDLGIRPYRAALGTIKVKDDVTFVLDVRAVAER